MEEKLQYEPLIFILAIIGLPMCCCVGIGAIPAGIAYFVATTELKKCYNREEPYVNQNGVYTGKIISLVVLIINIMFLINIAYTIYTVGWDELMKQSMEQSREMMEQYQ